MNTYKEIFNLILKREYALLGRTQTQNIFNELGLSIDESGNLLEEGNYNEEILQQLITKLKQTFGYIAILVIRLPVRRKLMQNNINMPEALM